MRNQTLDIAKFIGLFLMVFCHIPMPSDEFHEVVYSFHMPFFFFAGGLFYKPERFTFKKGLTTLIIPYVILNILIIVMNSCMGILSHTFSWDEVFKGLVGILVASSVSNSIGTLPSGPSWFLVAFFIVKILAKYILTVQNIYFRSLLIIIPVLSVVVIKDSWSWSVWSIDSAIVGSLFFYMAYYIKEYFFKLLQWKYSYLLLLMLVPITGMSWINGQVDMFACTYGNNFYFFLLFAIIGIFTLCIFSSQLKLPSKILGVIIKGSIFIIVMNMWLIDYLSLVYRIVLHNQKSFLWYDKLSITMCVFIISFCVTPILLKYTPFVLGKINNNSYGYRK